MQHQPYQRRTQTPIINVIIAAIEKATKRLRRDFMEVENLQVTKKGPGDFVSSADQYAEKILVKELQKAYPNYSFLLEEAGEIIGDDPDRRWVIDPLDGTTNFLHGIPHFAISIALEHNGKVVAAVVYDVIKDELFWAAEGKGAWLENRRLYVSGRKNLDEILILTDPPLPGAPHIEKAITIYARAVSHASSVRSFGSAALSLAYVAAGRADAYIEYGLKPWDVAAGILLVEEAGGHVRSIEETHNYKAGESIFASNKAGYKRILNIIKPGS